jgi:hypothetical protein
MSANNSALQKKILTQKLRLPTYLSREAASIIRQVRNSARPSYAEAISLVG